jgi:phospholipid/cholesterol/gamma-HCH transport system substrate-binding protein
METKANYVLIGLFSLAVVAAAFGFVFWFHNVGGTKDRAVYSVRFDGSVSGLRKGSSVLFNGIRVGEVTDLKLSLSDPRQVNAVIAIEQNTPVRADTVVSLDFQGLTGIASVALAGGAASSPLLVPSEDKPPVLVADASATQDVTRAARDVLQHVDALITRNSERVDNILAGLENLTGGPEGKGDIQEAARSIRQLADDLNQRAAEVTAGINRFTATGAREVESFAAEGKRTLGEINAAVKTIDGTVKNLDRNPSRLLFGGSGNAVPAYNGRR